MFHVSCHVPYIPGTIRDPTVDPRSLRRVNFQGDSRKMVLKDDCSAERIREIVAPLSPKLLSSSLINKMINELAVYQIQSNECLLSDMKDKEVLENIIEFWSEIASSLERVRPPLLFAATDIS